MMETDDLDILLARRRRERARKRNRLIVFAAAGVTALLAVVVLVVALGGKREKPEAKGDPQQVGKPEPGGEAAEQPKKGDSISGVRPGILFDTGTPEKPGSAGKMPWEKPKPKN